MKEILVLEKLKEIKEFNNEKAIEEILLKFQPLVKKYVRKLFFMEVDDAYQEIYLAILEAINSIKIYDNEAMCIYYIQKTVINKYNNLVKKNIRESSYIDNTKGLLEDIGVMGNINEQELYMVLEKLMEKYNKKQKQMIKYFVNELSD